MDSRLHEKLSLWHKQIEVLKSIEKIYLELEASEKSLFGTLYLKAEGDTAKEREARVYASDEWKKFKNGLVEAEVAYHKEKRILELRQKAFDAEYLSCKVEQDAIRRAG